MSSSKCTFSIFPVDFPKCFHYEEEIFVEEVESIRVAMVTSQIRRIKSCGVHGTVD